MRRILFVLSILLTAASVFGQKGIVKGTIRDNTLNEGVFGASVLLKETGTGTTTDFDGNFEIIVDAGTYTIQISYIGYKTVVLQDVEIVENEETIINLGIEENVEQIEEVVVVAKSDRSSSAVLMLERKQSTLLTQAIGAQELARLGAGDAAEGLKKVVGLSVQGSKFVVVRGLGDRYNSSTLNGFPVAAPNPDRRVLPYDIFPSNVLNNINIVKSFSPQLYGNFSGAAIDIVTKDYPDQRFLELSISGKANTQSTFKNFYLDPEQQHDVLGYNSSREVPRLVDEFYQRWPNRNFDSRVMSGYTEENFFSTKYDPRQVAAPPGMSFNLTYGDKLRLNNQGSEIGVVVNVNHSQDYNRSLGYLRTINDPSGLSFRQDFNFNQDVFSTVTSGLANITYKIDRNNSISFKNLYTHMTDNAVLETWGAWYDNDDYVYSRRNTYLQYQLMANQLMGEHNLNDKLALRWGGSYSKADAAEPDRRQVSYLYPEGDFSPENPDFRLNRRDQSENHHFFTDLNDTDLTGRLQLQYNFKRYNEEETTHLILGGDIQNKTRDFFLRQYNLIFSNEVSGKQLDPLKTDELITIGNLNNGVYRVLEGTQPQDRYDAQLNIYAPYLIFNWQIVPGKLGLNIGTRVEIAEQYVEFNQTQNQVEGLEPPTRNTLKSADFLPSLILKYNFTEDQIGRISMSRTISRPDFRELAPYEYRESFGAFRTVGNPELQNAFNYNLDLRYEFLSRDQGLFAVGLFGKYLDQPIVQNVAAGSNPVKSFQNGQYAYVAGAEVEISRNLGFLSPSLRNFELNANVTGLYTQIKIDDQSQGGTNQTTNIRKLEGASPFLVNLDLNYQNNISESFGYDLTVSYNVFGRRLANIGYLGTGDIFELPVNSLNFISNLRLGRNYRWGLNLSALNVLNPQIRTEQELPANQEMGTIELNNFRRGVEFKIGLSYRII